MTPLMLIQQHIPRMSRFSLTFSDGAKYVVRAFDAICAEHLACADRLARGLDLKIVSFRRDLADEDLYPQLLTFISNELPELSAENVGSGLVSIREAARISGISERALEGRIKTNRVRSFKVGDRRLLSPERHLGMSDPPKSKKTEKFIFNGAGDLTLPKAARFLGICKQTLYELVRAGKFPADKGENGWWRISMNGHIIPYLKTREE